MNEAMHRCIGTGLDGYKTCLSTAMDRTVGGRRKTRRAHPLPADDGIARCADVAHFMLIHTPHHKHTCRECAEICAECAEDCRRIGGMDECVAACEAYAESCRKMAA